MPPGLDSAATERWVPAERRACRGTFYTVFDETAVARTPQADSATAYRYKLYAAGVQCFSKT